MYAFIVSNLVKESTNIMVFNSLEAATDAYEEHLDDYEDDKFVLRITQGKSFGVNDTGSFGGEEILSNL
jgi:hypothetical protein